jgi:putative transposase
MTPSQIVPRLADRGEYIGSESTFYRTMRASHQLAHRGNQRAPKARYKPGYKDFKHAFSAESKVDPQI